MKSFIEDGSALKNDALDLEGAETQQPKLDSETKQVRIFILKYFDCRVLLLFFHSISRNFSGCAHVDLNCPDIHYMLGSLANI